jgi:heparin binding hemagglutinin HbhA
MSPITTITRSKPFYVAAGAADLAVKNLREVPAKLSTVKVDRRDVEKAVAGLQVQAAQLPARAQATALGLTGEVVGRADAVYGELLGRGRSVVGRIRRQKSTQDLKKDAATTVRRTKATGTAAETSAAETAGTAKKATKRTTTTARKRAATTRSTARSATTAARKTATSSAEATRAGAEKLGS